MGFIGKEKLWGLYASLKNTRKTNKKKWIRKLGNYQKKQHKMKGEKNQNKKMEKKNSPLVSELWPAHGKKGRGSTIPTKETRATPKWEE
jgi:hypothetical protein